MFANNKSFALVFPVTVLDKLGMLITGSDPVCIITIMLFIFVVIDDTPAGTAATSGNAIILSLRSINTSVICSSVRSVLA